MRGATTRRGARGRLRTRLRHRSYATAEAQAKFEHEAATLDLSDAEQLALWATRMAEQGDAAESERLADLSARRYESADGHQQTAQRLETKLDQAT